MRVPRDIAIAFTLVFIINAVHSALNLDGTPATEPVRDDDPSPIGDIDAYDADYHDCPLPCKNYSNPQSWITSFSVQRLQRC